MYRVYGICTTIFFLKINRARPNGWCVHINQRKHTFDIQHCQWEKTLQTNLHFPHLLPIIILLKRIQLNMTYGIILCIYNKENNTIWRCHVHIISKILSTMIISWIWNELINTTQYNKAAETEKNKYIMIEYPDKEKVFISKK